jgi:ribosome recycling factor
VDFEGDEYPLHEIASISKKDPKRIIIDCSSFPQAAPEIVKAIQSSGMNLNPQQEGIRIYVPIPKVTKEYRERLAKGAKDSMNSTKNDLRKVFSKFNSNLGDKELEHSTGTKDQFRAVKEVLQSIFDHFAKEADTLAATKQKELMGGK